MVPEPVHAAIIGSGNIGTDLMIKMIGGQEDMIVDVALDLPMQKAA